MNNIFNIQSDKALIHINYKGEIYNVTIDLADLEKVSVFDSWRIISGRSNRKYVVTCAKIDGIKSTDKWGYLLHRYIDDTPDDMLLYFLDGNYLNCSRSNLKRGNISDVHVCASLRTGPRHRNKIGHKWIFWNNNLRRYIATKPGNKRYLGCFVKLEDAIAAVDNYKKYGTLPVKPVKITGIRYDKRCTVHPFNVCYNGTSKYFTNKEEAIVYRQTLKDWRARPR